MKKCVQTCATRDEADKDAEETGQSPSGPLPANQVRWFSSVFLLKSGLSLAVCSAPKDPEDSDDSGFRKMLPWNL